MDEKKLTALAETAISKCVGDTTNVKGLGEIAEVARLVLGFPERLVKLWGQELLVGKIEVDGVFCHSTPEAHWNDPTSVPPAEKHPELCDLLIVVDDYSSHGGRERRALLLQAKQGSGGMFQVGSGGPCIQRYMFANWPEFYLVGRPLPNLVDVDLAPATPGTCPGSRYALVDTSAVTGQWSLEAVQARSINPFSSFNDYACKEQAPMILGQALVSMLKGDLGSSCKGQWGRLVSHLLKLAQERTAENRQPAGVKSSTVGAVLPHSVHASTFVNSLLTIDRLPSFLSHSMCSQWREDMRSRSTLRSDQYFEPMEGFGVLHIKVTARKWRNED